MIAKFLFPQKCMGCQKVIADGEAFCPACKKEAPFVPENACCVCGSELAPGYLFPVCAVCRRQKHVFKQNFVPFFYKGMVRKAILQLKFYKKISLCRSFSGFMARLVKQGGAQIDLVTFVPQTRRRQAKRGYNQSQFLAKFVAKELGLPTGSCLKKIRETPKQSTLNASARRENLKGAFAPRKNCPVEGKTVLLVDDVLTTGATMDECAKVLRKCGAKAIYCTTCAITKPE